MHHCDLFEIDSLADGEHSAVPGDGTRERNVVLRYRWFNFNREINYHDYD